MVHIAINVILILSSDIHLFMAQKRNQPSCADNAYVIPYNLRLYRTGMEERTERAGLSDCWKFQESPSFIIHHPQSVSISILLFIKSGKMRPCWWFFLFSAPFTVNKSCPVLTRRACHRRRLPFHGVILEHKSISHFSITVTFLCVMSRCLEILLKSRIMEFFPTGRAPLDGHVWQQKLRH